MDNRLWVAAIIATTPLLALSPVASPPSHTAGCVRPIPGSMYNQRHFIALMRRKDAIAERTLAVYKVMRVKPDEVRPVTDVATCMRAANAYTRAVNNSNTSRKVHILRVGDRFIVMDPEFLVDDYHRVVTFDSTFSEPLAFVAE